MRRPQPVKLKALVQLFQTLKDNIRVVVLNACWTRPQVEEIAQTIDFAIGMNQPIGDTAAIVFAASFYQAIGFGRTLQEAFDLAKVALLLEGLRQDEIPEMFVRSGASASEGFFSHSLRSVDERRVASGALSYASFEKLAEQVKSAKTLVDLVWYIGNAATQWRYERDHDGDAYSRNQAEAACFQYRSSYEHKNARIKILGMSEPVELAMIYTEVRIVPPAFLARLQEPGRAPGIVHSQRAQPGFS